MHPRFRRPLTAAALAALVLVPHAARAADPGEVAAARRALRAAVTQGSEAELFAARNTFAALAAGEPESNALHYWVALADWRLVPRLMAKDKPQAGKLCRDGLQHLATALARDPGFAEAMALRAGLQGLSLSFEPSAAMTLGPEMELTYRKAQELAPQNPRVRFLHALNTLNKPSFVGGGADQALPQFREAIDRFEAAAATDSTAIDWGRDDAYLWAGRSAMKLGDFAAARDFYHRALAAAPGHAWVEHVLLPEAEQALAGAAPGAKDAKDATTAKGAKAEGRRKS